MQNRLSMATDYDSSAQATEKYMMRVEDIFAEPSDSALSGQLTRFWGSWAALSISPESSAARQQVLSEADQLVYTLRRADTELTGTLDFASGEFNVIADEINNLTSQIAELNGAVVSAGPMTTAQSDLWDQRDRLVHRLSELTGATQRVRADGQVAVFISGRTLVDNKTILRVQATATSLQWEGDLNPVEAAGHVGALHTLVTSTIPGVRTKLDSVAS
jgi:flagellar hook-associated protein 1 FlgK